MKDKIFEVAFDAIEVFNAQTPKNANAKALKAVGKLNLPGLVGSDAHQLEEIGKCLLYFPESTRNWEGVIENIKKECFETSTGTTDLPKMSLRHIKRNFEIQILKRGV